MTPPVSSCVKPEPSSRCVGAPLRRNSGLHASRCLGVRFPCNSRFAEVPPRRNSYTTLFVFGRITGYRKVSPIVVPPGYLNTVVTIAGAVGNHKAYLPAGTLDILEQYGYQYPDDLIDLVLVAKIERDPDRIVECSFQFGIVQSPQEFEGTPLHQTSEPPEEKSFRLLALLDKYCCSCLGLSKNEI